MENPDLVLQETGSRPTYSRLNYVPSGDTLRRDAISSLQIEYEMLVLAHTDLRKYEATVGFLAIFYKQKIYTTSLFFVCKRD